MPELISRQDLEEKIDRGDDFTLVETLAAEQYRKAHLPGALNLPPDEVGERAGEVLPDKSADIILYCAKPA